MWTGSTHRLEVRCDRRGVVQRGRVDDDEVVVTQRLADGRRAQRRRDARPQLLGVQNRRHLQAYGEGGGGQL